MGKDSVLDLGMDSLLVHDMDRSSVLEDIDRDSIWEGRDSIWEDRDSVWDFE